MSKVTDSEGFLFKYFLSCCAATISESGTVLWLLHLALNCFYVICVTVGGQLRWAQCLSGNPPPCVLLVEMFNCNQRFCDDRGIGLGQCFAVSLHSCIYLLFIYYKNRTRIDRQIDIAYFNVRSKAGKCQLNLPHGTKN